ncbi:MAG: hypothetical protein O7C58_08730 [Rickettsia endosymbiont of Ixodes persulcatus]|nr:hypothetical protein [Rickettsia endosymbiont of Ixodes persulcatus]MCZ6903958.1 hypothetical protein [Rickettsia endosymbiont of Ixodes persulcatus]MCZ6908843.1 hypothetical protein [Rickettsia endosymbiont of Ixodes persulcatus]MCZ6925021.1 hypothetical protein [Rickettsia endosymbiont of Ixodes persulcatus]
MKKYKNVHEQLSGKVLTHHKEEYLAEKVGKLAVKAFINTQPIINRAEKTNIKEVLSQPSRNLPKTIEQIKKMQQTFKNYPITQSSIQSPKSTPSFKKNNSQQHER